MEKAAFVRTDIVVTAFTSGANETNMKYCSDQSASTITRLIKCFLTVWCVMFASFQIRCRRSLPVFLSLQLLQWLLYSLMYDSANIPPWRDISCGLKSDDPTALSTVIHLHSRYIITPHAKNMNCWKQGKKRSIWELVSKADIMESFSAGDVGKQDHVLV